MAEMIFDLDAIVLERPSVVTIGSFDGIHRGHLHLIDSVVRDAQARRAASVVVTLNPHPKLVLRPDSALLLLTTLEERLAVLNTLPLDYIVVLPFTLEQSKSRAREFVQRLLKHLKMVELVCGPNFALGYKREGTIPMLTELGKELGFSVQVVEPLTLDNGAVSSTRVRDLVAQGEIGGAARLLGRYPFLRGTVVHGDHRGRDLGYPTANLDLPAHKLIPANGIYAVRVRLGDEWYNGAASIGVRPTFGGGRRLVEVYIFDFDRMIYGEELEVHLVQRLRDELKFESVQALLEQMGRDVAEARRILDGIALPLPSRQFLEQSV